jgi:predicted glycogen debranching enzyme
MALLIWRLQGVRSAKLLIRPLLACRDHHATRRKTMPDDPGCHANRSTLHWQPFSGEPAVHAAHNGGYEHDPCWYHGFRYAEESRRGLDDIEDLWSPGRFTFELTPKNEGRLVFSSMPLAARVAASLDARKRAEAKRRGPAPKTSRAALLRASESYIVRRGKGRTIIAGYPWFTDWGRDTFISMRGLCLATRRLDVARGILLEWSKLVDRGMLPNFFPDGETEPHFNSVDASLWFIVTAAEYLKLARNRDRARLVPAMTAILKGYRDGTRFGIGLDKDGLIRAGVPGWQLTWMDAKYEDECFTPRIGKPVEIQALWLAALRAAAKLAAAPKERAEWNALHEKGVAAFRARFWNPDTKALFDVVDGPDGDDPAIRPNQLFAISLHDDLLPGAQARAVVKTVERELLTPMGLRTLSRNHSDYHGEYEGNHRKRDTAYHQGTVWPWLIGPFVESWLKVNGDTIAVRKKARKFLARLEAHLAEGCLGQVAEVASGDPPHRAGGCTAQAWSVAEMLRVLILLGK